MSLFTSIFNCLLPLILVSSQFSSNPLNSLSIFVQFHTYIDSVQSPFVQFNSYISIQCLPKLIQSCGLGRAVKLTQFWGLSRFLMPSISSSVMELKRDKCSRANKRTRRFIVQRDTLKTLYSNL